MCQYSWREIDDLADYRRLCGMKCYYYMEKWRGFGYEVGGANQKVFDLKMPLNQNTVNQRYYRTKRIKEFATDLAHGFKKVKRFTVVPSSKMPSDPAYNDMMELVVKELCILRPDLVFYNLIKIRENMPSCHEQGGPREPDEILPFYLYDQTLPGLEPVAIVDDVLTTGGHLGACYRFLSERYSEVEFVGVAWARVVNRPDS